MEYKTKYSLLYRLIWGFVFLLIILSGVFLLGFGIKDNDSIKLGLAIPGGILIILSVIVPLATFMIQVQLNENELIVKRFFFIKNINLEDIESIEKTKTFGLSYNAHHEVLKINTKNKRPIYVSLIDVDVFCNEIAKSHPQIKIDGEK